MEALSSFCVFPLLRVCPCVTVRMHTHNSVSSGTHFVCVIVYSAVFQLSECIRLSGRTNTAVNVTDSAWNGCGDCAIKGSVFVNIDSAGTTDHRSPV